MLLVIYFFFLKDCSNSERNFVHPRENFWIVEYNTVFFKFGRAFTCFQQCLNFEKLSLVGSRVNRVWSLFRLDIWFFKWLSYHGGFERFCLLFFSFTISLIVSWIFVRKFSVGITMCVRSPNFSSKFSRNWDIKRFLNFSFFVKLKSVFRILFLGTFWENFAKVA